MVTSIAPLRAIKPLTFDDKRSRPIGGLDSQTVPNLIAILWDAPPPEKARRTGQTGGHGQPFDWPALAALLANDPAARAHPAILAGGLRIENVAEAIAKVRPFAVDVSSGVESSLGVKDAAMITAFCQAVRDVDAGLR